MSKYVIIRSDTKSISPPVSKQEAIKKLKQYDREGVSTYLVYRNEYLNINYLTNSNLYE